MAFIIAIQPDSQQAALLVGALKKFRDLDVLVVESTDAALSAVDERVPDVVLVHPFIDPGDDVHLRAYLRASPPAAHVQVLTIPALGPLHPSARVPQSSERLKEKSRQARPAASDSRFLSADVLGYASWVYALCVGAESRPSRQLHEMNVQLMPIGCDPRLFASDVLGYVSLAYSLKQTVSERRAFEPQSDRRRAYRWSPYDVPWIASVEMPEGDLAALVDLSSGGALLLTERRPGRALFTSSVPQAADHRALTLRLTSGEELRIAGQVIRCSVGSREEKSGLYEVAFRFDDSADAFIPASPDCSAPAAEAARMLAAGPLSSALTTIRRIA